MTDGPVQIITPRVANFAERISSAWQKSVAAILETSRLLTEARETLDRGEWSRLLGRNGAGPLLPFRKSHAYRLLAIAEQADRFVPHGGQLPSDTHTLYELSRLAKTRFEALLESGRIHPGMKRNEAAAETRQERREADEQRVLSLQPADGKFRTLVVDPPWHYDADFLGRGRPGYATMRQDELVALPISQWAEDDCHLYLWTTNALLPDAVELVGHWGFEYKSALTWVKPRWGLGAYFRGSTEHVLFGTRGPLKIRSDRIATHFEAPLGAHSEKPERFYEIVREASFPPYGEAFQRKARPDFVNLFEKTEPA